MMIGFIQCRWYHHIFRLQETPHHVQYGGFSHIYGLLEETVSKLPVSTKYDNSETELKAEIDNKVLAYIVVIGKRRVAGHQEV